MNAMSQYANPNAGSPAMISEAEPRTHSTPDAAVRPEKTSEFVRGSPLVYLLSIYPAVSHTFFLNEVLELRKLGFIIEVASINQPDRPRSMMPTAEVEETDRTFYVKSLGSTQAAWIAAKTILLRPHIFFRGLVAALRLGRWDLIATLYALLYFAEGLILGDWMRLRGHRHLHVHFCGPVATVGMLASITWGFPYSLTVHGPDEFYNVDNFYLQQKVERAKFIVCISDFARSQLMRVACAEHWNKMHVVRLGVDPQVFFSTQRERDAERPQEILCVGRLVASKGQLILLQACERLLLEGHSLQVRLVGAGPDREHLEAFAKQKGIPAIFEGAKTHDETQQILEEADVFVLASFAEGVPVALMEAMAMEIPCVSTYVAGIPELIRDGLDGLLVPASSVDALATALKRLQEDPLLRRGLGISGCKRVLEFYNLPRNVSTLARVFIEHLPETI